jgi:hypothetical protein
VAGLSRLAVLGSDGMARHPLEIGVASSSLAAGTGSVSWIVAPCRSPPAKR